MKERLVQNGFTCAAAFLISAAPVIAQSGQNDRAGMLLKTASTVLQGLCEGNHGPLAEQPLSGLPYLEKVVSPLHDRALSWRIPPEILLYELDPMLPPALNNRMLTDQEFYSDTMQLGLDAGFSMLLGFAEAREQNMATGAFDPAGEAAAMMQGLSGGMSGFGLSLASAERDANVMIALLMEPEALPTFRACYDVRPEQCPCH